MQKKPEPNHNSIRRIILPSGRTLEVLKLEVYDAPRRSLHACPECGCQLVQPVDWREARRGQWELTLECPNCWWTCDGVFSQAEVDELEERLDDGLADMLNDLRRLAEANMAEEVDRFAAALQRDLILPEDF